MTVKTSFSAGRRSSRKIESDRLVEARLFASRAEISLKKKSKEM